MREPASARTLDAQPTDESEAEDDEPPPRRRLIKRAAVSTDDDGGADTSRSPLSVPTRSSTAPTERFEATDDDVDVVIARPPAAKRRRVIASSDDEEEDSERPASVSTARKGKPAFYIAVPPLSQERRDLAA